MNRYKKLTRRLIPSPAMVVALLALFVAMSGTVYAAAKINGKNIKAGSITAKQIKKSTLTGKQVKDGSLSSADLKAGTIPAGPAAFTTSNGAEVDLVSDLNTSKNVITKSLPAGKYAVSGHVNGFYVTDNASDEANLVCNAKVNGTTVIFLFAATGGTLNIPYDFTIDAAAASTFTVDCSAGYDSPGALTGVFVGKGAASFNAVTVSSIG
jgi:hypothetical protein